MTDQVSSRPVQDVKISMIKVGERHRKDLGDINTLAASIEFLGLLQPIGLDASYRLIFGERRLRAFERLGRESIPARIVHVPSLLIAEHAENEIRKEFTPSERVGIAKAIEDEIGNRQGQRTDRLRADLPEVEHGQRTRDVAAEKAGFDSTTAYRQAKAVVERADPALVDAMDRGAIAISTAAKLATSPAETQRYAAENPKEAPTIAHNHRAQGTGDNEWYTPPEYIEAARVVLGAFDLDPATSALANETVGAARTFTKDDNGLAREWSGRVWMNPPYSQPDITLFSEKLASEWETGNVSAAIALTHNYTDTAWFHRLASTCRAICFTRGRIGFLSPTGSKAAPTQGQAFFYFGPDIQRFTERFSSIGFVVEVRQ